MGRAATYRMAGSILSTAFLATGCSTAVPALRDETQLSTSAVVRGIQCEMREAVREAMRDGRRPWLKDWEAAYGLTLNMTETGAVAAIGQTPVAASTVLAAIGAGGNVSETRRRIAKLNFVATVPEIKKYRCDDHRTVRDHPFVPGVELGRAGFSDWLNRALDAVDLAAAPDDVVPSGKRPISVGHTFEFIIQVDANASAGFTLLPAGGASFGPSLAIGRIDNHSLEVGFAPSKVSVRTIKVPSEEVIPGRPPSPEEAVRLERLRVDVAQLSAQLSAPEPSIQGFDTLSPAGKVQAKTELRRKLERDRLEVSRLEAAQRPSTRVRLRTETIVETSPVDAQDTLAQLQIERLLSGRRF